MLGTRLENRQIVTAAVVAAAIGALAWGTFRAMEPAPVAAAVTDAEARAEFQQVNDFVLAHGMAGAQRICDEFEGSTLCSQFVVQAGGFAVPTSPPRIVDSYELQNGNTRAPGRVLVLCGADGNGNPYETEFLVQRSDGELITPYPVFWIGIRIATTAEPQREYRPPNRCA